jgi:hypothetical protein
MVVELSRREKEANIKPDPDIDVLMKVRMKILNRKTCVGFPFLLQICHFITRAHKRVHIDLFMSNTLGF